MNCIVEGIISHAHTRPSSLHPLPVDDDASQERFAVPRASTVNKAGRLEYGFPEGRTFKTIKQHAFEAQKRAEAEAEADLVEQPQGRRHLQHTVFAHREEQKVLDELSAARPSKMINVELWATSKENPLHPAASLFVDEARHEADLADHDGRAARMVSRNGPGGYDKDKRYATRHKYDQRRVEENEADAIRMTNMTENRAEYTNGYARIAHITNHEP